MGKPDRRNFLARLLALPLAPLAAKEGAGGVHARLIPGTLSRMASLSGAGMMSSSEAVHHFANGSSLRISPALSAAEVIRATDAPEWETPCPLPREGVDPEIGTFILMVDMTFGGIPSPPMR